MADTYDFTPIEDKYGLPHGYLANVRRIESGNGQNTYNKSSGAAGDFQFIPGTARQYGLKDPYNTMDAADATARLAQDNRVALQQAGIDNPTGAQLYLAHQQGPKGAIKLLQGQGPAGGLVGNNAVAWNGGDPNGSGQTFANMVMAKYGNDQGPNVPGGGILNPAAPTQAQPSPGGLLNFAKALGGQQAPQQSGGLLTGMMGLPGLVSSNPQQSASQQSPLAAPQQPQLQMPQIRYFRPQINQAALAKIPGFYQG